MPGKSKSIFVTLPEFLEWIRDVQTRIPGCAVVCYRVGRPMELWRGSDDEVLAASRLYLVERLPTLRKPTVESLNEEGMGWVQVDVPCVAGNTLRLCQVAAKSDWWNKARSESQQNRSSMRFFDTVWRVLRAHLGFPVWARNVRTGATSAYKAVGYSEGARAWYLGGGELAQEGVDNIAYEIRQ